jgi:hypothetical protein
MKEIARLPLAFPSDVAHLLVKTDREVIYLEVWQRGEDESLITAQLTRADAYWLRSALGRARACAKKKEAAWKR